MARIAAIFPLACGALIDLGICRYTGKGQSELVLLRTLMNVFRPGDVMLADRLMCAWTEMVMLKQRSVDSENAVLARESRGLAAGVRVHADGLRAGTGATQAEYA